LHLRGNNSFRNPHSDAKLWHYAWMRVMAQAVVTHRALDLCLPPIRVADLVR